MTLFDSVRTGSRRLLERAGNGSRVGWKLLVGVILVPVLFASGFLWATWRADDRLRTVQAAVVNLDEAVTINGQITPLGRQLTAELVNSKREQNITWVLSDAEDAEAGLKSGRYAAVITIPKTFSAAATSFSKNDDSAHQATIQITTSEITGVVDGAVANTLAQAAVAALNRMVTEQYLDNIYLGFNKMGKQFQTVVDGADELADGGRQLADGIGEAADGADKLDDGMSQLADGGTKLADGGTKLADGGTKLADGADKLAKGVDEYTDGVSKLSKGMTRYSKGVAAFAKGADTYADAIDENFKPLAKYLDQLPDTVIDLKQAAKDARAFSDLVDAWSKSGVDLKAQLKAANDAVQAYTKQVDVYVDTMQALADGTKTLPCPDEIKNQYGDAGCAGFNAGIQAMAKQAVAQIEGIGGKQGLQAMADELAKQSQAAYDTLAPMMVDAATLAKTADEVADSLEKMAAKTPTISTADLKKQIAQLLNAPRQLADGAAQLSDGASQLATGTSKLATGGEKLDAGAYTYAKGVRQFSDGVNTYVTGVKTYTDGVSAAADGVSGLADGLDKLEDGAGKLADGQRKLADGLAKGVKQMPTYDKSTREKLSTAVSEPLSSSSLDDLVVPRVVWASLLMVLAMWLGALATYVLFKAVSSRVMMSDASTPRLVARAMAPGLGIVGVQALAVAVIGQLAVQLPWQKVGLMLAFLALAAVAFVALNQALVAWFKGAGRLISVVFVVLTFASALTYAVPRFFAVARNLSPLTPALDGLRAIMTDGSALTSSMLALLGWAVLGIGGALAAILRARKLTVDQLIARTGS